jgi:lipopolysaccharide/colanic/teichoic acid biosynthesis glycosyltransferase/F0F1-type ATP synthase assembly protein I
VRDESLTVGLPVPTSPAPAGAARAAVTGATRAAPAQARRAPVPAARPDRTERPARRTHWEVRYRRTLLGADLAVGLAAGGLAFLTRFGGSGITTHTQVYLLASALFPLVFVAVLAANQAYERRRLYVGTDEYQRVIQTGLWLVAGAAIVSYALEIPLARGWLLVVLPAATLACLTARFAIRKRLHRAHARGERLRRVIVVGHELAVMDLAARLSRERYHGMEVVGACLPPPRDGGPVPLSGGGGPVPPLCVPVLPVADAGSPVGAVLPAGDGALPVHGTFDDVSEAVEAAGADTVVVLGCPELDGLVLRRLAWRLERDDVDLILASSLIDVAGDRTTIRPVDGLPMLHVEHPRLTGGARLVKEVVDRAGAALLLAVTAPLLLAVALCVRVSSPGPVLFRQVRVGKDGREFVMHKFRTMYLDAEARLAGLRHLNEHDGVLFKIRNDPRVTRVGRWLRRLSLDELPQLWNVLHGEMSLVGPRPPLPEEVAAYPDDLRRRLAVKPGMTGLWQVSGRADLPWDEAVRLDLRYVENWSLSLDLVIVLRTLAAVCRTSGAY